MYELRGYLPVASFGDLKEYLRSNQWAWINPYRSMMARKLLEMVYPETDPNTPVRAAQFVITPHTTGPGVRIYYVLRIWGLPEPLQQPGLRGPVEDLFGGAGVRIGALDQDPSFPHVDIYYTKP